MSARAYKLRLTRVPPCCPHCLGAAAWVLSISHFCNRRATPEHSMPKQVCMNQASTRLPAASALASFGETLAGRARKEGSVPSTPHLHRCHGDARRNPKERKQGLATSPLSEEKKLPAAEAKASKPPATAAGSNQKPHRAQQWQQNAGGPWGRHRYTHRNQDPAALGHARSAGGPASGRPGARPCRSTPTAA